MFPFFAPFIIAIVVSYINEPVIRILKKFKIPRKIAAVISLLITMSLLATVVTLGIIKIYEVSNDDQFVSDTFELHHLDEYCDELMESKNKTK